MRDRILAEAIPRPIVCFGFKGECIIRKEVTQLRAETSLGPVSVELQTYKLFDICESVAMRREARVYDRMPILIGDFPGASVTTLETLDL